MALTPETLTRHELNGLEVEVVEAANPDLVGIAGRVVIETMRTLHVDDGTRVRQVPKRGATLQFRLPNGDHCEHSESRRTDEAAGSRRDSTDGAPSDARGGREAPGTASKLASETAGRRPGQSGACEDGAYVTVDGARLLSRPALRTENAGDSTWR